MSPSVIVCAGKLSWSGSVFWWDNRAIAKVVNALYNKAHCVLINRLLSPQDLPMSYLNALRFVQGYDGVLPGCCKRPELMEQFKQKCDIILTSTVRHKLNCWTLWKSFFCKKHWISDRYIYKIYLIYRQNLILCYDWCNVYDNYHHWWSFLRLKITILGFSVFLINA